MGEFPQGEAPGAPGAGGSEQTAAGGDSGTAGGDSTGEPGWGDGAGAASEELPDLLDEQSMEDVLAAMEAAMGEPGGGGAPPGGTPPGGAPPGTGPGEGGALPGGGSPDGGGDPAAGGNFPGRGSASTGPLTPAEQVAILDGQLEQGTGEFDAMILEEQNEQRRAAREREVSNPRQQPAGPSSGGAGAGDGEMADAGDYGAGGGYSTGGGMGGASPGGEMPKNTAKYPPPADIPNGNDDDVVARQLREAAMREPDPAIREKLWDEYRKYKGIEK